MKSNKLFLLALLASLIMFGANITTAQQRVGSIAAPELIIPVGGRDFALSGSSLATSSGVEAIYWNPAGLGKMSGSAEGLFSTMNYIADINVVYGAVGGKLGDFGYIALSVKSLRIGDIPLTTDSDPEGLGGAYYSPTLVTVGMTYSRSLTDNVTIGATGKIISEQIDRVSSSGFAFDFGVQYKGLVSVPGLNLGIAVKNIGPTMKFDGPGLYKNAISTDGRRPVQQYKLDAASFELPAVVELGLSYDYRMGENMLLSTNGAYSNNTLYFDEYRGGLELGMNLGEIWLFGRGGFSSIPQVTDKTFGPTFGFGVNYNSGGASVAFDYAYRTAEYFSGNQVISLKVGF